MPREDSIRTFCLFCTDSPLLLISSLALEPLVSCLYTAAIEVGDVQIAAQKK